MRSRLRNPPPRAVDVLVTLAAGLPTLIGSIASGAGQGRTVAGVLFGLAATLPLLVRRRRPFAALATILAAGALATVDVPFQLPLVLALYTIGAHRSWEATIAAGGGVVAVAVLYALVGSVPLSSGDILGAALLCAIGCGSGLYVGSKRASIAGLEARTAQLARERELLAREAVAEERVRIAQELHDVVGHNVSLIVVQAQALGATEPAVKAATDEIAGLGRATMAEMHRTLRLLRDREDGPEFTPQPGLDDLDGLLARSRAAGLDVELAVEGAPRRLAQSVDLSAFRIVQEALTNVVKHAGRARTCVTIVYGADALELTIVDSGDGGSQEPARSGGHGLIGMRERAALFGGTLTAGPQPGAGFAVRASLPYDEETT
jgi:signal transduction histidine kinase